MKTNNYKAWVIILMAIKILKTIVNINDFAISIDVKLKNDDNSYQFNSIVSIAKNNRDELM